MDNLYLETMRGQSPNREGASLGIEKGKSNPRQEKSDGISYSYSKTYLIKL